MGLRARLLGAGWLALTSACAHGEPREIEPWHWEGVDRVVAIGDLHGDYGQYLKVLRSAGLVNSRGKWTGEATHLVQTGDITDRGPDSRKIIDHLAELKVQASRDGGRVHTLVGNHEAMNSYGDLRYVHPGEFEAFRGRNSELYRDRQWAHHLEQLKRVRPEAFLTMNLEAYRTEWEQKTPLGWVEHRLAWQPDGEYGQLVLSNPVVIRINDSLFLHGGISPAVCDMDLSEINRRAETELRNYDPDMAMIIGDEQGPLWYRGLATEDEVAFAPQLDQILKRYGVDRIVVGHTPTGGVVWPRFGGRVVVNDTGIAAYYGGHDAYLELHDGAAYAGYSNEKIPLPATEEARLDYLREVIERAPDNSDLRALLASTEAAAQAIDSDAADPPPVSPDICQPATR